MFQYFNSIDTIVRVVKVSVGLLVLAFTFIIECFSCCRVNRSKMTQSIRFFSSTNLLVLYGLLSLLLTQQLNNIACDTSIDESAPVRPARCCKYQFICTWQSIVKVNCTFQRQINAPCHLVEWCNAIKINSSIGLFFFLSFLSSVRLITRKLKQVRVSIDWKKTDRQLLTVMMNRTIRNKSDDDDCKGREEEQENRTREHSRLTGEGERRETRLTPSKGYQERARGRNIRQRYAEGARYTKKRC